RPVAGDRVLGPTWQQLFERRATPRPPRLPWWRAKRAQLLGALGEADAAFVYDLEVLRTAARSLKQLQAISRVHYSMKANPHTQLTAALRAEGIDFECVARGEVERLTEQFPDLDPARILYTPNFAARAELACALERGVRVTVDNAYMLERWPQLFAGRELFLRLDTGVGRGHHDHVRTAGTRSKFGVPLSEVRVLAGLAQAAGARITGLQAHVGSG